LFYPFFIDTGSSFHGIFVASQSVHRSDINWAAASAAEGLFFA